MREIIKKEKLFQITCSQSQVLEVLPRSSGYDATQSVKLRRCCQGDITTERGYVSRIDGLGSEGDTEV
jgi:hypothetical protein